MPQSPQISEDEADRPSGFPGAKLKYTQTIMGGRSGGLGLRVNGKRASTSKRMSGAINSEEAAVASVADWPKVPEVPPPAPSPKQPAAATLALSTPETSSPRPQVKIEGPSAVDGAPVTKAVQFVPKFKGAAEMERRRRARMAARRGPNGALAAPPPPQQPLSFSSSEDEAQPQSSDESSLDSDFGGGRREGADEVDEFDP